MNQDLRNHALVLANTHTSGGEYESPEEVVKRAETYYKFLTYEEKKATEE